VRVLRQVDRVLILPCIHPPFDFPDRIAWSLRYSFSDQELDKWTKTANDIGDQWIGKKPTEGPSGNSKTHLKKNIEDSKQFDQGNQTGDGYRAKAELDQLAEELSLKSEQFTVKIVRWSDTIKTLKEEGLFDLFVNIVRFLEKCFGESYNQSNKHIFINKCILSYVLCEMGLTYLTVFRSQYQFNNKDSVFHLYPGTFYPRFCQVPYELLSNFFPWAYYPEHIKQYKPLPKLIQIQTEIKKSTGKILAQYITQKTLPSIFGYENPKPYAGSKLEKLSEVVSKTQFHRCLNAPSEAETKNILENCIDSSTDPHLIATIVTDALRKRDRLYEIRAIHNLYDPEAQINKDLKLQWLLSTLSSKNIEYRYNENQIDISKEGIIKRLLAYCSFINRPSLRKKKIIFPTIQPIQVDATPEYVKERSEREEGDYRPAITQIDDFIKDEKQNALLLIGTSGSGKTSSINAYIERYIFNFNMNKQEHIPIPVNLYHLKAIADKTKDLPIDMDKYVSWILGINITLLKQIDQCSFAFILDGFDEIQWNEKFNITSEINEKTIRNSKIIKTCRQSYYKKIKHHFSDRNRYSILYTSPLSSKQIHFSLHIYSLLRTRYQSNQNYPERWDFAKLDKRIQEYPALQKLSENLLYLLMLINYLPGNWKKLVPPENNDLYKKHTRILTLPGIKVFKLYHILCNRKGGLYNDLIRANKNTLSNKTKLNKRASFFDLAEICTQNLTDDNRTNNQHYPESMGHHSIVDYLVANDVFENIFGGQRNSRLDFLKIWERKDIMKFIEQCCDTHLAAISLRNHQETINFIAEMVNGEQQHVTLLLDIMRASTTSLSDKGADLKLRTASNNAARILHAAYFNFSDLCLDHMRLKDVDFTGGYFHNTTFWHAELHNVFLEPHTINDWSSVTDNAISCSFENLFSNSIIVSFCW